MEHLSRLLLELERITLQDIAQIPKPQQHILVEHIEELQDELRELIEEEV
ncbi:MULTISPECIES: hypothetical protein [Marinomonas]|jgi:hypothetical protein|nr:hypothetical protein [Marinomonas sp. KMM3893]